MANATVEKVKSAFPGALTNASLVAKVQQELSAYGYGKTTLVASSLCCDEVNRGLENDFAGVFGDHFSMGGLAGFPFGGVTSFGAMAHHIPIGGSCLVIYGPHVGVDSDGKVGKVDRRGRPGSGTCCGSAAAAAGYVKSVASGQIEEACPPAVPLDIQQYFVGSALLPFAKDLEVAEDSDVQLPLSLFEAIDDMMKKIVKAGCKEVGGSGLITLIGGVQINTPEGTSDYFLPKTFEIWSNKGTTIKKIILRSA